MAPVFGEKTVMFYPLRNLKKKKKKERLSHFIVFFTGPIGGYYGNKDNFCNYYLSLERTGIKNRLSWEKKNTGTKVFIPPTLTTFSFPNLFSEHPIDHIQVSITLNLAGDH